MCAAAGAVKETGSGLTAEVTTGAPATTRRPATGSTPQFPHMPRGAAPALPVPRGGGRGLGVSRGLPGALDLKSLEREIAVPAGKKTILRFFVAPTSRGDWELRVQVDGKERHKLNVTPPNADWKEVKIDLSDAAMLPVPATYTVSATSDEIFDVHREKVERP